MTKKSMKKKTKKTGRSKERPSTEKTKKPKRTKAIMLLIVALFFFAYMIYAGGSTVGYISLVIGLVCGLLGASYLYESKRNRSKSRG